MNKVIVYPLTSLSTPFYRKKKPVVWTLDTPLVIVRVVSSESVVVKPFGKGCYRELEVNAALLGTLCSSTASATAKDSCFVSLNTRMSIAEAIKYLKIK